MSSEKTTNPNPPVFRGQSWSPATSATGSAGEARHRNPLQHRILPMKAVFVRVIVKATMKFALGTESSGTSEGSRGGDENDARSSHRGCGISGIALVRLPARPGLGSAVDRQPGYGNARQRAAPCRQSSIQNDAAGRHEVH